MHIAWRDTTGTQLFVIDVFHRVCCWCISLHFGVVNHQFPVTDLNSVVGCHSKHPQSLTPQPLIELTLPVLEMTTGIIIILHELDTGAILNTYYTSPALSNILWAIWVEAGMSWEWPSEYDWLRIVGNNLEWTVNDLQWPGMAWKWLGMAWEWY